MQIAEITVLMINTDPSDHALENYQYSHKYSVTLCNFEGSASCQDYLVVKYPPCEFVNTWDLTFYEEAYADKFPNSINDFCAKQNK